MSEQNKTGIIVFNDNISQGSVQDLLKRFQIAIQKGCDEILLAMSSHGGEVTAALHAYSCIRALPMKITTHATAVVDSAGIILFGVGGIRKCVSYSRFLFHPVTSSPVQGVVGPEQVQEYANLAQSDSSRVKEVIGDILGDLALATQLIDNRKILTPSQAVEHGLCAEVLNLTYPKSPEIISLPSK